MHKRMDGQTDRWTETKTDRQTDTDRQMDTHRKTDSQRDKQKNTEGIIDLKTDGNKQRQTKKHAGRNTDR